MSQTIHILPKTLAAKIAAGEVVQRPASVVKELIENSIDAHADSTQIIIKEGGKSFIQVVDNGDGMDSEDATIAFERHATSKISTDTDLEDIRTLGFRGEALAAIAAISQIELRTRQRSSEIATKVRNEGGSIIEVTQDSSTPGTSVTVKNLFYNTPARRNFLKSNSTEFRHIFDVVQRFAIAYPEFTIQFINDGETILNLRPVIRFERIRDIFSQKVAESLIEFNEESDYVSIGGFLGKPDFSRRVRVEQFLYLNNRSILSRSINHAVFQGYENLLERGSFPFFILFLTIDPKKVDVNVHPSKMEVKFADESSIYRSVFSSVRRALSKHDLIPVVGTQVQGSLKSEKDLNIQNQIKSISPQITPWRDLFKRDQSKSTTEIPSTSQTDQ
ncbi:MAG TPA: DNA mismatch repair endonuclease MutL, partial [Bacteroidota bacterium]|nr:DNA mismatch repair endonuclease MutL [Bacteroidota bacterium]